MKYSELKKILTKNGCRFDHDGGRHELWYSPHTNTLFALGRHNSKEVPTGTVNAIFKQAGIKR